MPDRRFLLSRRQFLYSAAACGALPLAAVPPSGGDSDNAIRPGDDGFIELRAQPAIVSLRGPDQPNTLVWTYNGRVAGPEIRVRHGDAVKVRLINDLQEPTTIHWHGMRIDNAMDGVPGLTMPAVEPGQTFDYVFTPPDAGTYWYHSHHRAYAQIDRGLYGPLVIEEREPIGVDRDLMLVIDDWDLLDNGCIDEVNFEDRRAWAREGRLGNMFTVNGASNARFQVRRGERVRLRCVNGCNSSIISFDIFRMPLLVIAWDGQMMAEPVKFELQPIALSPGQRVDFVIEITDEAPAEIGVRLSWNGQTHVVATLEVAEDRVTPAPELTLVPAHLEELDLAGAMRVPLRIHGGSGSTRYRGGFDLRTYREIGQFWRFNDVSNSQLHGGYGIGEPLFDVALGTSVVIDIHNDNYFGHAMHFHGHHFRIIEKRGQPVEGSLWRDTELVRAEEKMSIGIVANNPGKWLYHCHMAEHAAGGMGGWFNVRG